MKTILLLFIFISLLSFSFGQENIIPFQAPEMPLYQKLIEMSDAEESFLRQNNDSAQLMKTTLPTINWIRSNNISFTSKSSSTGYYFLIMMEEWRTNDLKYILIFTDSTKYLNINLDFDALYTLTSNKNGSMILMRWGDFVNWPPTDPARVLTGTETEDNLLLDNSNLINYDTNNADSIVFFNFIESEETYIPYKVLTGEKLKTSYKGNLDEYFSQYMGIMSETNILGITTIGSDVYTKKAMALYNFESDEWSTRIITPPLPIALDERLENYYADVYYYGGGIAPFAVWDTDSIVYNARYKTYSKNETVCLTVMIKENFSGEYEILTWSMHYDYEDDSKSAKDMINTTYDRFFYPTNDGKIESFYSTVNNKYELLFDVDQLNNCILFLRGGTPWKLDL